MSEDNITIDLLRYSAAQGVIFVAHETHTDMASAFRAARRLTGSRRPVQHDGIMYSLTGKNGTAYITRWAPQPETPKVDFGTLSQEQKHFWGLCLMLPGREDEIRKLTNEQRAELYARSMKN